MKNLIGLIGLLGSIEVKILENYEQLSKRQMRHKRYTVEVINDPLEKFEKGRIFFNIKESNIKVSSN